MYYKVGSYEELYNTVFKQAKQAEDCVYIEYVDGHLNPDWKQISVQELVEVFGYNPFEEKSEPQPYQPTNAEVAQMISDLQVDLILAGVI